jgi:hypothetical protein
VYARPRRGSSNHFLVHAHQSFRAGNRGPRISWNAFVCSVRRDDLRTTHSTASCKD